MKSNGSERLQAGSGEPDDLVEEFAHFEKWFDETWESLKYMGRNNPFPQLVEIRAFNPEWIIWGLYRCCDYIRAKSLPAARERLRSQIRHFRNCVSLSNKLNTELAHLERATINPRLMRMLPDLSAELSIAPGDIGKLRAELMMWCERFAANETRFSSVANQRASFAANSDDKIALMCHMRNAVGRAAPGKLVSLLHAGFGGHGRDDVITSQSLINLEDRFQENYPKMYMECKGLADRMTEQGKKLVDHERDLWRRGTPSDRRILKDSYRPYLRDYLSQSKRPTRHS